LISGVGPYGPCGTTELAALATRILLALLLVTSGALKAKAPSDAGEILAELKVVHRENAGRMVVLIAICECALGVGLFVGLHVIVLLILCVGFFIVSSTALVHLMRRGYAGSCGCFGTHSRSTIGPVDLARNAVLLTASFVTTAVVLRGGCAGVGASDFPLGVYVLATVGAVASISLYRLATEIERVWFEMKNDVGEAT
jgi:hypothetical protein